MVKEELNEKRTEQKEESTEGRTGEMKEKKTKMVKFRWYFDTDKETEWLNRMAEKGWALTGFGLGFYRFERCEPGEYIYQIDATDKLFGVSEDYRQFMEEMGAEIVCIWGFYAFLRRKAAEGPFQLYTDVEFSISHYSKIINRFETVEAIEAAGMLSGIYCAVQEINSFGWVLAFLAGSLFLVFQRQAARVKKELKELKNRREETGIQTEEGRRANGLLKGVAIVASSLGAVVLYAVLHELGHCIAVWLCGGTVTGFYPFGAAGYMKPHMLYEGITGGFANGLVDIFGSVLPLAAVVLLLLFWKGSKKHSLLNICVGIVSGCFLFTTLSWVVEPIGRLVNRFDYNSDVSKFIDATGLHPVVVMLGAILVLGLTCFLFVKRRSRLSLGFIDRRAAVRFLAFLLTVGFVTLLLSFFGSVGKGWVLAQGKVMYTVSDNKDSILQGEYEIQVAEPGEYTWNVEWKLDRQGAVGGFVFKGEDKIYLKFTADLVEAKFSLGDLESGSYTLCFYLLTSWEDWLEWCEITGQEVSDLADYNWEPGLPATLTGSYRFIRSMREDNFENVGTRSIFAQDNVTYAVSDSEDAILQKEYELQVTEPGEYTCFVEWKLDRKGVIGGMALKGEDETIHLACTGNQVQSEFLPVFLESGSYTICFYYLDCEEDWLEYCEITGLEAGNLVDYFWEPGLPAVFTGSYQIYSNLSEENSASNSASGGN